MREMSSNIGRKYSSADVSVIKDRSISSQDLVFTKIIKFSNPLRASGLFVAIYSSAVIDVYFPHSKLEFVQSD